jgi:hypothetical protein
MPASHGVKKAKPFGPFFSASACGDRIFQGRAMWQFMGRAFAFDGIAPGLVPAQGGNAADRRFRWRTQTNVPANLKGSIR